MASAAGLTRDRAADFFGIVYDWQGAQIALICFDELTDCKDIKHPSIFLGSPMLVGTREHFRTARPESEGFSNNLPKREVFCGFLILFLGCVYPTRVSLAITKPIDMKPVKKVEAHIVDAIGEGWLVVAGGKRAIDNGSFFEPTV